MADTNATPHNERPTLGAQLARQHELLMATLTKPARTGSQTAEYGEKATGADAGKLYLKSLVLVQHEDESDVQFLGRQQDRLTRIATMLDTLNSDSPAPEAGEEGETE